MNEIKITSCSQYVFEGIGAKEDETNLLVAEKDNPTSYFMQKKGITEYALRPKGGINLFSSSGTMIISEIAGSEEVDSVAEVDEEVVHEKDEELLRQAEALNQKVEKLDRQGHYAEAEPLARQVLEIREKVLGKDHLDVALSLNNLARLLQAQGDYFGAQPLFERALKINEQVLGENHPDVAMSLNNLAF